MKSELLRGPNGRIEPTAELELRVHGIGDQHLLDALGHPPILSSGYPKKPDTFGPPSLPAHTLRLINWSRTSRRTARFLWYLALPFTLINVAGNMAPAPQGPWQRIAKWTLRAVVVIIGLVATVSVQLWLVAIIETGVRWIDLSATPWLRDLAWLSPGNPQLPNLMVSTVLGLGIAVRMAYLLLAKVEGQRLPVVLVGVLNLLGILTTAGVLYWWPPTLWRAPAGVDFLTVQSPATQADLETLREWHASMPLEDYCARLGQNPQLLTTRWDTLTALAAASMLVVLALGTLLIAVSLFTHSPIAKGWGSSPKSPSLAGAAMVLTIALALIHGTGAALRFGVGWIATYLDGFDGFTVVGQGTGPGPLDRLFMPAYGGACLSAGSVADRLPLYIAVCLLVLIASVVAINLFWPRGARWPKRWNKTGRSQYIHRLISSLPHTLLPSLVLALAVSVWIAIRFLLTTWITGALGTPVTALLSQIIALMIVVFVLLTGHIHSISKAYGQVADIAGFWPIEWHPLTGRSYREPVSRWIRAELNREGLERVVLVGHSQGSVICAWLIVMNDGEQDKRVHLVTCGSPLYSLYATFFPSYFSADFFDELNTRTLSLANFWRETDPIATPIPTAQPSENHLLEDPLDPQQDPKPRVHSDYWIDPDQTSHITSKLAE